MGPSGLLCPVTYNAVKTVLDIMLSCFVCYKQSDWLKGVITCIDHINDILGHSLLTCNNLSSDLPHHNFSIKERK